MKVIPLKYWLIVIIATFIIQLLLFALGRIGYNYTAYNIHYQLIDFEINYNKKENNVVFIGSSRLEKGLFCNSSLRTNTKNLNFKIHKIYHSNDVLNEYLVNSDLIDRLVRLKPEIVCIQTDWATLDFNYEQDDFLKLELVKNKNVIAVLWHTIFTKKTIKQEDCTNTNKIFNDSLELKKRIPKTIKTPEKTKIIFEALKKLKKAGIKTFIIDIPLPSIKEAFYKKEIDTIGLNKLLKEYKTKTGVTYIKYDGRKMFYSYYYDEGHLNSYGQYIYSNWFIEKLKLK